MAKEKGCAKIKADDGSWLTVHREGSKICVFSSEECSDVPLSAKQAKELIEAIKKCINEG